MTTHIVDILYSVSNGNHSNGNLKRKHAREEEKKLMELTLEYRKKLIAELRYLKRKMRRIGLGPKEQHKFTILKERLAITRKAVRSGRPAVVYCQTHPTDDSAHLVPLERLVAVLDAQYCMVHQPKTRKKQRRRKDH